MDKFESMRAFVQVVEAGGFAAAARDMGVSRSAVNKLVMNLEEALQVLKSGRPKLLHFGVADELAWEVGLACGGTIEVFVEQLDW